MRSASCFWGIASVCSVLLPATPALAQSDTGVQPLVLVTAVAVGSEGTAAGSAGSGAEPAIPGKPVTHYIFTGASTAGASAVCQLGASDGTVLSFEDLIGTRSQVWKITTTLADYQAGKETTDVEWSRYEAGSGGRAVASGHQRLSLLQGQRYVLDLVQAQPPARCGHVQLEVEAAAREDAALADTVIQYDVWLVHRDPSGRKDSRHVILTGLQGGELPFDFAPLRFDVPKLVANQFDLTVATKVRGHIRGRVGADGNITLDLGTTRTNELALRGESASPGISGRGEGRKILQVKPEEAVAIELPSGSGFTSRYASAADAEAGKNRVTRIGAGGGAGAGGGTGAIGGAGGSISGTKPTEPVSYSGGRIVVQFPRFFDGHTFSVIVQAKKQGEQSWKLATGSW